MQKIVIAPDSFKGSLSSIDVTNAIGKEILGILKDIDVWEVPISDGGEGFVDEMLQPPEVKLREPISL
jgi:glycerate kinase